MPQPNINPSPRQQFQESADNISRHRRMIESNEFDRGIHFALLQMQADLCNPASDGNRAAASHFMMMGAIEFVKTLRLLGEKPTPLTTMKPEHLDHKA